MRVTWWGHSTVTLQDAGTRLLTDPVAGDRIAHLRRRRGPGLPEDALAVDAVLISHLHGDHLDLPSLRRLDPAVRVIAPVGTRGFLASRRAGTALARRCEQVQAGDVVDIGRLRIEVAGAAHDDRRHPWSRHRAAPVTFVVSGSARTWIGGDTDLHGSMSTLAPIDLALVPVGGWGLNLGPGHLDPAQAVTAVRRLGARHAIPVHFGTFWPIGLDRAGAHMFLPPGARFAELAADGAPGTQVHVLDPGQCWELPRGDKDRGPAGPGGPAGPVESAGPGDSAGPAESAGPVASPPPDEHTDQRRGGHREERNESTSHGGQNPAGAP